MNNALNSTIGIVYDRIRWEEKTLSEEVKAKGLGVKLIDAKNLKLDSTSTSDAIKDTFGDVVLERCISYYRGLHVSLYLERNGLMVINPFQVANICGNKFSTSLILSKAGVPTPRTILSFTVESTLQALDKMGFPAVLKPITGSWGRMVSLIKDRETAQALLEMREYAPGALNQIYYIQEFVKRPPRDIRAIVVGDEIVTTVYRHAPPDDWRTNVARGGKTTPCKLTKELNDIIIDAAQAVGGGVLGVDAMETPDGFIINEINSTVEFRGAAAATDANISSAIVDYASSLLKR